ncbi:MAG: hypothetical protein P4L16_06460 [Chlamydiales bacterium]|nr:hypothetical protein [Chlamydiales bacterium]
MTDPIGARERERELAELRKISEQPSIKAPGAPAQNIYRDAVSSTGPSLNLNIPEASVPVLPTLPKPASNVATKSVKEQLNTIESSLNIKLKDSVPTPSSSGLESYVGIMAKIDVFQKTEMSAVERVDATLDALELGVLASWLNKGTDVATLAQNKAPTESETAQLQAASAALGNCLMANLDGYSPDFIASVASSLAQTKKDIATILEAISGSEGGNALVVYTATKNQIDIASNKLEQALGNLDTAGGAYNLAQANLMEASAMAMQKFTEDIASLQGKIESTNKLISGLKWAIVGLSILGVLASFGSFNPAVGASIGIGLALATVTLGAAQIQVGLYMKQMAGDQKALAKDTLQYQTAKINSQQAQTFVDFMTQTIGGTFQSVKQIEEAFQQALQAVQSSTHDLTG